MFTRLNQRLSIVLFLLFANGRQATSNGGNNGVISTYNSPLFFGPSEQPEAFFNGSSYLRLQTTISLKKQTGISFKTCNGGNLFSQLQGEEKFELLVKNDEITFHAKASGKTFEEKIPGNYTDNKWHTVYLQYNLGNLTITIDHETWLLANSTYNHEVLTSSGLYNEGAAVLLIGQKFNGCIQEGPSIVFDKKIISSSHNVHFGQCPLTNSCVPTKINNNQDLCSTSKLCFNGGSCVMDGDHYSCTCHPRFAGKNCEQDQGDPCGKNPNLCSGNGICESTKLGEYFCSCNPNFTGTHCEVKIISNPLCAQFPCGNGGVCIAQDGIVKCKCKEGFVGKHCEVNIDECGSNPCQNGGNCVDGANNFTCDCSMIGYTGRFCEIDVNECTSINPCRNNGVCFNTHGGFLCQCQLGFIGTHCEFTSNECQSQPCYNRGICVDKQGGGYECRCPMGFLGDNCEIEMRTNEFCTTKSCQPFGECRNNGVCYCKHEYPGIFPNCSIPIDPVCLPNPCRNGGICAGTNSNEAPFSCSCPPGFTGATCERRHEHNHSYDYGLCQPNFCRNGATCVVETANNNYNRCVCAEGYTGKMCETRLRCEHEPCTHAVACQDYLGGYYCTCDAGWTGRNCDFEQLAQCASNPCLNGATCTDLYNYFTCQCAPGYTGSVCQINVDECASSPCQNGGTCADKINGFSCNCTADFMGERCELPYNACELTTSCQNNSTCILGSNKHSYTCNCSEGFEGEHCEINIDDCSDIACPNGKVCVDLVHAYECRCPNGYGGENCTIDLDPCAREPCSNNGICTVDKITPHHFTCTCPPGYNGEYCDQDINECTQNNANICNNGICVNTQGGFQCYCKPGYTGELCNLDFDECLSMPCKNNATCLNKINKFECVCPPGYSGKDCSVNIDECASNPCSKGSTCVDQINAYVCICQPGLTGLNCEINKDDCESSPCQHNSLCIDGLNSYTCNCTETGYTGVHCEINIDDCASNPCQNAGTCVDLVKEYNCKCYSGYAGKNCEEDINECESNPCQHNGECLERSNRSLYEFSNNSTNSGDLPEVFSSDFNYENAAGYECICVAGISGKNCEIDIDECQSSPCLHGKCEDLINEYKCLCDDGFEGQNCNIDIDECAKFSPCMYGHCIDKRADYFCACDPNHGGKNCSVELIGCLDNPCKYGGTCKPFLFNETEHRFNCSCSNGFYGPTCEKITTISLSKNSQITVNTTRDEGYDIQFRFKTTLGDGLLAIGKSFTYYILELSRGRLNLHSSLLNKWEGAFVGSNLNNSEWQRVFVAINATHLVLSANDEQTINVINFNDNPNNVSTVFPTTYIGGIPNNLRKLTHTQPFLVGCMEDILVNSEWILPEEQNPNISFSNVETSCKRTPQCEPNPCQSGGHCTDRWREFSCTCKRPFLGNTCQYNFTAATFGYENITDSLVTVMVHDYARRAVRSVVDISMFIRTRQAYGKIFYLGSGTHSPEETFISAELVAGELQISIQFNGIPENFLVSGVHLDNGYNHLIEVIRNITLVQVKLNRTELFRKTLPATATLDAQVLFLGGQPPQIRSIRQATSTANYETKPETQTLTPSTVSPANFKGIIQDVQISNGSMIMVVEFYPLTADELNIPLSFGMVNFSRDLVKEGVLTDDTCKDSPCQHGATCEVTWNDYKCHCVRGFKGKDCKELEFCEIENCPVGSQCKNLEDGIECIANASFSANSKSKALRYKLTIPNNLTKSLDKIVINYRTRSWGTVFFTKLKDDYFTIFIYHNEIIIEWSLDGVTDTKKFRKDNFKGQWLSLLFKFKENNFKGGFLESFNDGYPNIELEDFNTTALVQLLTSSEIYIAGSDGETFDFHDIINGADNTTGYIPSARYATGSVADENGNLNSIEHEFNTPPLYKVDENKKTDKFKGCLGEIRIGDILLPFFTHDELNNISNHYTREYYELISETKPETGCVLCYDTDCFNSGNCINQTETYQCKCPDGYAADDCSVDIDECAVNQCQNNATCVDLIAKYRCDCIAGYEGERCEMEINECLSNPCRHGGTCVDLIGTFKCNCPEDFVGKQCEAPLLITCDNKPCRDGATCQPGANQITLNNFTCICTENMEGPLCDTPFCHFKECEHGFCNSSTDVPFCECKQGFDGIFCENNIDDCVLSTGGSPCQNGGVCIDGINRYNCNCNGTGFSGLLCEMDINECEENENICGLGLCINQPGTFECNCENLTGKCGYGCSLNDPCFGENPCENGGECTSNCGEKPDFICKCVENYTGANCSEFMVAKSSSDGGFNILYIVVPLFFIIFIGLAIGMVILVNVARSKRATRGTYSPSAQEFCNPRVELDHVLKPPPEERLI